MRNIIYLLKTYPSIISVAVIFLFGIMLIIITSKAYAAYNEEGCGCVNQKSCPTNMPSIVDVKCLPSGDASTGTYCYCPSAREPFIVCSTPAIQKCKWIAEGCGCCDDDDCNIVDEDLWGRHADGCPYHCGPCWNVEGNCPRSNPDIECDHVNCNYTQIGTIDEHYP